MVLHDVCVLTLVAIFFFVLEKHLSTAFDAFQIELSKSFPFSFW